ncbi:hypothetical protein BC831DRAFT_382556, partial [Entophlyctis helioformis]
WSKYAHHFRAAPASHLVAFAILHEATAVLPLPIIYYLLAVTDIKIPFPETVLAEGNRRISSAKPLLSDDSQVMLHMATSYAIVKALMPVRVGLCFLLTPWAARCVCPA